MRHNQRLDYEKLREEAAQAVSASGKMQKQIAQELGYSPALISRALNEKPGSEEEAPFAKVLVELIEHLTPYTVAKEPLTFRAKRKDSE